MDRHGISPKISKYCDGSLQFKHRTKILNGKYNTEDMMSFSTSINKVVEAPVAQVEFA